MRCAVGELTEALEEMAMLRNMVVWGRRVLDDSD